MRSRSFPSLRQPKARLLLAAALCLPLGLVAAANSASHEASRSRTPQRAGIRLLSIDAAPVIRGQPRSQGVVVNLPATLEVFAEGDAPLSFSWSKDGATLVPTTNLTVVSNSALEFLSFTTNDAGVYRVTVSNPFGSVTSEPAILSLLPNPYISQQPESQIVVEGGIVALGVTADGTESLLYYWFKDGVSLSNVFGPSLIFSPVSATNAGVYQVVVSNAVGMATSDLATLTVKPNTPRLLRTLDLEFPATNRAVVPIQFAAQGNERSLSFSIEFDPAVLRNPAASLTEEAESRLPSARLTVNDIESAQGRIGLSVTLAPADLMPTQTFRLADVHFVLADPAWSQAGLAFGGVPVPLLATDGSNAPLPVLDFVSPVLTIGTMPSGPDAQSGLFLQTLTLVNPSALKITGLDVLVHGLTNDTLGKPIRVENASGNTDGVPLVYYGPLLPGAQTDLTVEYYVADRRTLPAPEYEVRVVATRQFAIAGGLLFTITNVRYADNRALVEFQSLAGREYFIQYVEEIGSTAWRTAVPSIIGTGSRVQWIDDGPPKTISRPASATSRFYRGMLLP